MRLAGSLLLVWGAAAWAEPPQPACNLVPGWQQRGEQRSYIAENLFEYMDGNAEGYLIYGFQSMRGVTCINRYLRHGRYRFRVWDLHV